MLVAEPESKEQAGLECPKCGCRHFRTVKTRPRQGRYIYRRRECRHCGKMVTTTERIVG